MVPTVLISGTISGATYGYFSLPDGDHSCTLYADGLAGVEEVAIELMTSDETYMAWTTGAAALVLDVDNTVRSVNGPGEFRVACSSSAGAIEVGLYGALGS